MRQFAACRINHRPQYYACTSTWSSIDPPANMQGGAEGATNGLDKPGRDREAAFMEVAAKDGSAGMDNPKHIRFGAPRCAVFPAPNRARLHALLLLRAKMLLQDES